MLLYLHFILSNIFHNYKANIGRKKKINNNIDDLQTASQKEPERVYLLEGNFDSILFYHLSRLELL